MKKTAALLVLLVAISFPVFSQQAAIKGTVIDTSEKRNLSNTVIALLRPADSVLVSFTRSNAAGNFTLQKLSPGKFIIMVTRPTYADYFDKVEVAGGATVDLGNIAMTLKSQLLQEVVVQHKLGAIRIKGDTTEYIADSFKVAAGSTVEDLLKKLPGIQVDKDGKITAQGEKVQKVLVDGEEFFSDDPTIATRGLTADALDKVQSYDKKSDQAAFTGIDDGQKTKVLNLQLKEDKKKGYFGKAEAGTDGNRFWNNNLMFNAFKGKRKFSAFGIMSNTGKTGLDWREGMNYGGSSNVEMGSDDAGGVNISWSGDDDEFGYGDYWGEGLPRGWNAGLHYSNKWNADKIHLNSGYQYNKLNTDAKGNTFSQYILPDSTILYVNDGGNSYSSRDRNRLNGLYEFQIDSFSSLKITAQASRGNSFSHNNFHQESMNSAGDTLSIIDRESTAEADNKKFNTSLLWKQKFKKQGRTISLSARQNYSGNDAKGIYFSDNNYFKNSILDSTKILDQQKLTNNITSQVNSRIAYTEPLNKRSLLEFNYSIDNNHRKSRITTLEKSTPLGKYEDRIDSLSNDYSFNVLTQSGGISYRYARPKKITLSIGMNISNAAYTRKDLKGDSSIDYSFTNFYPQANLTWTLPGNGNVQFRYNGSTQAPSIDQIQPIRDITDQLNISVGNPDLKQAFRHQFNLRYNSFKFLSERNIYVNVNFTATQHDFSTLNTMDVSTGRKVSQPVNVNGNYNGYGWFYFGQKIMKWGLRAGINGRFNVNHNTNFIDGLKNENNSYSFGAGPNFSYYKEKKFSFWMESSFNRNVSKTSLRSDLVTRYWTQEHNADVNVFLPWKFEIGTSVNVNIRQKTSVFEKNNNSVKWNGRLDRKFFKNDVVRIRFSANDILNQNIGFNRDINNNFISERTYDTIRRNFMLSLIWNFSKNGKEMNW